MDVHNRVNKCLPRNIRLDLRLVEGYELLANSTNHGHYGRVH